LIVFERIETCKLTTSWFNVGYI